MLIIIMQDTINLMFDSSKSKGADVKKLIDENTVIEIESKKVGRIAYLKLKNNGK